jgi:hypothetical protein
MASNSSKYKLIRQVTGWAASNCYLQNKYNSFLIYRQILRSLVNTVPSIGQMMHVFHTNREAVFDTLILTTDLEIGLTACVAGRQGMFTPPRHLVPLLVYVEVLICRIP